MHNLTQNLIQNVEFDLKKSEQKPDKSIAKRLKLRKQKFTELNELIAENHKIIDKELFKRYFRYDSLGDMQTDLYMIKDTLSNNIKENLIKDKLDNFLKNAIDIMTMTKLSID